MSDLVAGWEVRKLAEVRLQEGESLENALRRFKRKVQQEDIVKEVKRHSFYLKPGEKKRACRKPWRESVLERKAGKNRIELRPKAAAPSSGLPKIVRQPCLLGVLAFSPR